MNISDILKVREKQKTVGYVVPTIEEQILLDALKRNKVRKTGVFHPSEISSDQFCAREWLLYQYNPDLYSPKTFGIDTQRRFDVGHVMHEYIQEKLGNAGVLLGVWECARACDAMHCTHIGFKPTKDTHCKESIWGYREPTVHDKDLNIWGNTDGIVVKGDKKYTIEYKTIKSSAFATLCAPVYNHREQACWYLDILMRHNFKEWNDLASCESTADIVAPLKDIMDMEYNGSVIIYQNKDTQDFREYFIDARLLLNKEFMVDESESLHTIMLSKKQVISDALAHFKDGTLCDRIYQCDDISAKRAQKCGARKECFAINLKEGDV